MSNRTLRLDAVALSRRDVSALSGDELIKHVRHVIAAPRSLGQRTAAAPVPVDPIAMQREALQSWGRKPSTSAKADGAFAQSTDAPFDYIAEQRAALHTWGRGPIAGR